MKNIDSPLIISSEQNEMNLLGLDYENLKKSNLNILEPTKEETDKAQINFIKNFYNFILTLKYPQKIDPQQQVLNKSDN